MLMGHADGLSKFGSAKNVLLSDPVSELDVDEEADDPSQVLYTASFEELASKNVQYDMIIWLSISLLLVLAWGVGTIMLLYLPFRRYVLQRDIASRKLYLTSKEIVYKVCRPSFIPFCGETKIERRVPLYLIIDIITEQGCLQSVYGLHTFRVESIARGKAAPVDEFQVQGVSNPGLLRKVVVTQASKAIQDAGRIWNHNIRTIVDPHHASEQPKGFIIPTDFMLHKLDQVNNSVKKIEFLIEKKQASAGPSLENV